MAKIKDSGHRSHFDSGAVRDVQEGKGRLDLVPLPEVVMFCKEYGASTEKLPPEWVYDYECTGDPVYLVRAAGAFAHTAFRNSYDAILEYAVHMEDGCKKYGDRNWQLGIPMERYVDSGLRHYFKTMRGDDDERHDRAFLWNMLCGAATCRMHPELNTFPARLEVPKQE